MYYIKKVEIPEGVKVSKENDTLIVEGPRGIVKRKLYYPNININIENSNIVISAYAPKRSLIRIINTFYSHIKNMVNGVVNEYVYKLKIVYKHFPITVKVQGNEFIIENFLGERAPRKAKILEGVNVKIEGNEITLSGPNIEAVGQTAANLEMATRIRRKDRRIFQDGIFIIKKAKKSLM